MLVIKRMHRSRPADESGAVLVTVLVVMLVGFVVASVVAASVLFTVQSNTSNRSRTQAFIAAESGRDAAVAGVVAGCGSTTFTGSNPTFASTVYVTSGNQPTSATDAGVAQGCPTATSRFIVIRSTGTGANGATTTIDSVYPWVVSYTQQPGGVVTYFSGGFTAGVSHYTGDLVLRNGNWACTQGAILTGDLYVLNGTVGFSNNCRVEGDIWANGNVTSNSQTIAVTGSITTNGLVSLSSNGGATVGKDINAGGNITLSDQGSSTGTVGGKVTSKNSITKGSSWTITGAQTPNGPDPVFDPTLAWLKAATQWIDFTSGTNWGTKYTATSVCNLVKNNPNPTIKGLLETPGTPLVLDFSSCTGNGNSAFAVNVALSNVTLQRDAVIIAGPSASLSANLSGTINPASGTTKQLLFIHNDASTNYVNGEPVPTCGNGNQKDTFNVSGVVSADVKVMMYSPCGLTGTLTSSFSGQLYTNDSTNLHSSGNITTTYTCAAMAWTPAFNQLGCKIKGQGGVQNGSQTQALGSLVYQTER
jgi:Tfp pilus assembly protein PilX/cytoskeletal protein CcmA (bactofilin family)